MGYSEKRNRRSRKDNTEEEGFKHGARRNLPTALIEGPAFGFGYVAGLTTVVSCAGANRYHRGTIRRTTMRAVYPSNLLNVDS
jgi:hypothetical protein